MTRRRGTQAQQRAQMTTMRVRKELDATAALVRVWAEAAPGMERWIRDVVVSLNAFAEYLRVQLHP